MKTSSKTTRKINLVHLLSLVICLALSPGNVRAEISLSKVLKPKNQSLDEIDSMVEFDNGVITVADGSNEMESVLNYLIFRELKYLKHPSL